MGPIDTSGSAVTESGKVKWVKENASMSSAAHKYEAGAPGAREGYAPALEYVDEAGKTRTVKFDGLDGNTPLAQNLN